MNNDGEKHQYEQQLGHLLELSSISPISDIGSTSTSSSIHSASYYTEQLMDDLSIIDDIYSSYDHEQLTLAINNQVTYSTRNGALKEQMVQHLIKTESQFVHDLDAFHTHFAAEMPQFQVQKNKLAFQTTDCDILFKPTLDLISAHQVLLDELRQRLSIYGPTQIISDIFLQFFDHTNASYTAYLKGFSSTLLTLDRLHKTNAFIKFCESRQQSNPSLKDCGYYICIPLIRLSAYTQAVDQCTQLTEPAHPDYNALITISKRYKTREQQWQSLVEDCLSHYKVYKWFRAVQNSPALVTPTRRLLLYSDLIHLDPDAPTDMTDHRTYILYNDLLIFCKQQKDGRMFYQGIVILDKAVLKPMDRKIANKIRDKHQKAIKQANGSRKLSLFGIKKQQQQQPQQQQQLKSNSSNQTSTRTSTTSDSSSSGSASSIYSEDSGVYGFEIFFQFVMDKNVTSYTNPITSYGMGPVTSVASNDSVRRHILLTRSLEEQTLWNEHLQRVIKSVTSSR
ncbi:Dbl homology domain-containing protein [Absidia repens]|uniref:Dbl homology domain-containing protein n=1 Tax=Absidia repens TaxID=90262 RepID=A0A1X2IYZ0_9FUNG|nr:Dbl homology domain-containing protein [Absidia repens]